MRLCVSFPLPVHIGTVGSETSRNSVRFCSTTRPQPVTEIVAIPAPALRTRMSTVRCIRWYPDAERVRVVRDTPNTYPETAVYGGVPARRSTAYPAHDGVALHAFRKRATKAGQRQRNSLPGIALFRVPPPFAAGTAAGC